MSGLPALPRAQKYQMVCNACGGRSLVRGAIDIREPEGAEQWSATQVRLEFACTRKSCEAINFLFLFTDGTGTVLQWRSYSEGMGNLFDGVRGGLKS